MVMMVCRFQHQGHTVNTREYWASSRIPDNVRDWIKERVSEGRDQKEIVQMIHEHQKNAANIPPTSPAFIPPGVQITRMDVYNIIKRHKNLQAHEHESSTQKLNATSDSAQPNDADTSHLPLTTLEAPDSSSVSTSTPLAITTDTRRAVDTSEIDHAAAAPYPILSTATQLSPASPEEAVSFAQQWSDLLTELQALQPQMMEYALTAGTTRQPNTTAAWSHAIAQLTQAWYVACNLLDRPVLPSQPPPPPPP